MLTWVLTHKEEITGWTKEKANIGRGNSMRRNPSSNTARWVQGLSTREVRGGDEPGENRRSGVLKHSDAMLCVIKNLSSPHPRFFLRGKHYSLVIS